MAAPARSTRCGNGPSEAAQAVLSGIDPDVVGARVLEAIKAGETYIFTHPNMREFVQARFAGIMAAFDVADASEALKAVKEWNDPLPRQPGQE